MSKKSELLGLAFFVFQVSEFGDVAPVSSSRDCTEHTLYSTTRIGLIWPLAQTKDILHIEDTNLLVCNPRGGPKRSLGKIQPAMRTVRDLNSLAGTGKNNGVLTYDIARAQ